MYLSGELCEQGMTGRNSDGRLADAAGPDDGNEAFARQPARYFIDGLIAAHHLRLTRGQIVGLRQRWRDRRRFCTIQARDLRHEAIALSGNGSQIFGAGLTVAKCPSKLGDMHPQAALVDVDAGPHPSQQFVLADDRARLLDEGHQDIECSSRKLEWAPVFFDAALCGLQKEWAKRKRSRCARVRVKPTSHTLYAVDHGWCAFSGELAVGYPMTAGLRISPSPIRRSSSSRAWSISSSTTAAPAWSGSKWIRKGRWPNGISTILAIARATASGSGSRGDSSARPASATSLMSAVGPSAYSSARTASRGLPERK